MKQQFLIITLILRFESFLYSIPGLISFRLWSTTASEQLMLNRNIVLSSIAVNAYRGSKLVQ